MNPLLDYLKTFVSESRQQLFFDILDQRTQHITLVLEDIHKSHNASATVRTCDCFGVQDLHIIEKSNQYKVNPYIVRGSSKWVDIHKYSTTEECFKKLKQDGYTIAVTTPNIEGQTPLNIPLTNKLAIVFGNEHEGISEEALNLADTKIQIPMYGFSESLNISVCVAIIMNQLVERLRESEINWKMSQQHKDLVYLQWIKASIKHVEKIESEYHSRLKNN